MNHFFSHILTIAFVMQCFNASAQSTPTSLDPSITVSNLITLNNGYKTVIKLDPVSKDLFVASLNGDIYRVQVPDSAAASSALEFTSADHQIPNVQGMCFIDSTIYIAGNTNAVSKRRTGKIAKGVLQGNGTRVWSVVAETELFTTAAFFNHLFTSIIPTENNDTLLWASGSRGDHGEVDDNFGSFPNVRTDPINSRILKIPANANNLTVPNDSTLLISQGFIYADGVRNTFDMAYNSVGDLFGAENAGDRDMDDEINWLRQGHHYGYPWYMGNRKSPSQFATYNPNTDLLINHASYAWTNGLFTNDPTFPPLPTGVTFTIPCANEGPDADIFRDSISGNLIDASGLGSARYVYSLTSHRSPLGLTFDVDSTLGGVYTGGGFVLSWTRGDSTLSGSSQLMSAMGDKSEDLLFMDMRKNTANDNYIFSAHKIIEDLETPVDAELIGNKMYILGSGSPNNPCIWLVEFPELCSNSAITLTTTKKNIDCHNIDNGTASAIPAGGTAPYSYLWNTVPEQTSSSIINLSGGNYSVTVTDNEGCTASTSVNIFNPSAVSTFSIVTHSNPTGSASGIINLLVTGGIAPYTYNWSTGAITEDVNSLVPGFYFVQVNDRNGCAKIESVIVN